MADRVLQVIDRQVRVSVAGGPLLASLAAQAAAAEVLPLTERAEAALAEIEDIASGAPDAPSILNKFHVVGLFSALSTPAIAATVTRVMTTGWHTVGVGSAQYIYDLAVDASYVSANPKTSFLATGGRGFRIALDQTITPWMFGLVGEVEGTFGGADEAGVIQSFFDFINDNECPDVDWTAWAAVGSQVTLGATDDVKSKSVRGRLFLRGRNDIATSVVKIASLPNDSRYGDLHVSCYGSFSFADRNTPVAIELGQVSRAYFGTLTGDNAQLWAVWATTNPGVGNSNLLQIEKVAGHQCGSGLSAGVGFSDTGTVNTVQQFGSAGSTGQYSRIVINTASDLPPLAIDTYKNGSSSETGPAGAWSTPLFLLMTSGVATGRVYHVTHLNRTSGRISVYPRMPDGVVLNDTFRFFFGGALCMSGSDTNIWEVGCLEAQNCGIGFSGNMLYGPNIGLALFDACGVAIHVGGSTSNSCFGTNINVSYFESSDIHLLTSSIDVDGNIGRTIAFDTAKVRDTVNPIDGTGAFTTNYSSFARIEAQVPEDGITYRGVKVVGPRGAAIANPTDAASTQAAVISILTQMRADGKIAT